MKVLLGTNNEPKGVPIMTVAAVPMIIIIINNVLSNTYNLSLPLGV